MTPHRSPRESGSFRLSDPRKLLRRTDRSDGIADFVLGIVVGVVAILALAGFIQ